MCGIVLGNDMCPPCRFCLQAILLYTEGVLIAQYIFLIPTRLECDFLTEPLQVALQHLPVALCCPIAAVMSA